VSKDFVCNACHCNKSHKLPFSVSTLISQKPLELIFSDVWTSPLSFVNGFKYHVIFVDHFTKYIWFYLLKKKFDVKSTFIRFKAILENYFNGKIMTLYSDNGGEYIVLTEFFVTHGISHLTTPHTPEHNGLLNAVIYIYIYIYIVEVGLSLLTYASLPFFFCLMLLLPRSISLITCLLLRYKIFHLMHLFFNIPQIMKNFIVLDVYVILDFALTLHIS